MIGNKPHADPIINNSRQIITNINFIETANINAINAWITSPNMMRVNPAHLSKTMFANRR
jgi:hypothetical protein